MAAVWSTEVGGCFWSSSDGFPTLNCVLLLWKFHIFHSIGVSLLLLIIYSLFFSKLCLKFISVENLFIFDISHYDKIYVHHSKSTIRIHTQTISILTKLDCIYIIYFIKKKTQLLIFKKNNLQCNS